MDTGTLSHKQQMLLEAVRKLVRRGAAPNLDRLLARRRPVEIAALFPHLNDWESRHLIGMILEHDLAFGARVIAELEAGQATTALEAQPRERLVLILSSIPSDDAANLLRLLPEEVAAEVVPQLKGDISEEVEELLAYNPESAGGLMSPDFFALLEECTVGEAITALQQAGDTLEMAFYLYITNASEQLVGVLSLRSLLTSPPTTPLKNIMITEVLSVHTSTDQEEVARMVARYNLLAIPVVDDFNKLVGIVTVDDVIDVMREEATEDILKMVGAGEEELGSRSTLHSVRTRAPWMLGTLFAGLLSSEIIRGYHPTLANTVLLAGFIPVMVGLSGNAGNQSAAVVARGISVTRIETRVLWRELFRELRVGLLLGLISGAILVGFVALRYPEGLVLALAVGVSATLSILTAVGLGALSPLLLQRLHLDPTVATGPFVSTVVDVLGIAIYFAFATTLLSAAGG